MPRLRRQAAMPTDLQHLRNEFTYYCRWSYSFTRASRSRELQGRKRDQLQGPCQQPGELLQDQPDGPPEVPSFMRIMHAPNHPLPGQVLRPASRLRDYLHPPRH